MKQGSVPELARLRTLVRLDSSCNAAHHSGRKKPDNLSALREHHGSSSDLICSKTGTFKDACTSGHSATADVQASSGTSSNKAQALSRRSLTYGGAGLCFVSILRFPFQALSLGSFSLCHSWPFGAPLLKPVEMPGGVPGSRPSIRFRD